MRDKTEDLILIGIILLIFLIITLMAIFCIVVRNAITDHKCYMMSDEEFFQTEMCKPYWNYRRNK